MDQHRQVLIFRTDSNEFRPFGLLKMRMLGFFAKPERFPPAIDSSRSSLLSKLPIQISRFQFLLDGAILFILHAYDCVARIPLA